MSSRWPADRLDPIRYLDPGLDLPVFYGDLDTQGHVNNVAFGRFVEQARYTAHRAVGMAEIFMVARVSVDYLREGRFGTPLHVRTRAARIGTASVIEEQAAWQDGECVALAEVVMVYTHDGASTPLTTRMRDVVQRLQPAGVT